MSKYENLSTEEMAEKYKLLKDSERIRNKKCYDKMKADFPEKYKDRLMKNRQYIDQYLDNIKQDEERLEQYKKQRAYSNALYYYSNQH